MLTPIYLDMRDILSQVWAKYYFFSNFMYTICMASSEVMTSSAHSFAYSYRLVKKCFVKICETSKYHNFLIFQPIFIRFSLLCLKIFTLFSEIKLNLFRISPLKPMYRAVYTGIKNPEFFSHSGFSLEVARQLPLNTAKTWIEKSTSEVWFFETPPVFHCFFANVNARSPLTGIIQVFGHVGRDLLRNHPRPATYCALRTVKGREKSRMRTTYQKNSMRFRFFRACPFLAKKTKSYGFSGSVNGTTKNPGFLDFGFCQCKWAL